MNNGIFKTRYWVGLLYPENMVEDWQKKIGDIVQVPFAYCVHDQDLERDGDEERKVHVHLILVFPNTTTYKHAFNVFSLLNAPGKKSINKCEAIVNIRNKYDYLIHDTEAARSQGKFLYDASLRVTGNLFDIGAYEQLSKVEKRDMLRDLCDYIISQKITNFADFYIGASQNFDPEFFEIVTANNAFLDRLTRGNYQKYIGSRVSETHEEQIEKCPECGSTEVKKNGKTAGGMVRFRCKECGKSYC